MGLSGEEGQLQVSGLTDWFWVRLWFESAMKIGFPV
jgi:hypothetical protein